MASYITVKIQGGEVLTEQEFETVGELKEALDLTDYEATVNGEPSDDDDELEEGNFVALNKPSKSGR